MTAVEYGVLGSSSSGNGIWIGAERALLIDCGFSVRRTISRLDALGVEASTIAGIVLTHEHSDHAGGAARVARRLGVPVLGTQGTLAGLRDRSGYERVPLALDAWSSFAGFDIRLFGVPHDAREPAGVRVRHGDRSLAVLTDSGSWNARIAQEIRGADAIYVESNHDVDLLATGPYPVPLQRRIRGGHGHLSNDACGQLLANTLTPATRRVVLGHLSRYNNTPELALATNHGLLARAGVRPPEIIAAEPFQAMGPWALA